MKRWTVAVFATVLAMCSGTGSSRSILRIDPTLEGGAAQSIDAKLDFAVKKNAAGTVMIRWLPELLYKDMRNAPARAFGMFPDGSNYMGMTVWPLVTAREFVTQLVFPYSHPQAQQVRVVEQRDLPDLARMLQQAQQAMMPGVSFGYDAAVVKATYLDAGVSYDEVLVAAVEDWGQVGAGAWKNRSTLYARAPRGELADWEPVLGVILNSVGLNAQWVAGEIQGQITRGQIAQRTYSEVQRIGQEIVEHQQKTNAEIHSDVFLTLTEQEEYVNPYTNEVEVGSNQWKHRWVNESGEVIYTDVEDYDPNLDVTSGSGLNI
jgi:hypothetical protein